MKVKLRLTGTQYDTLCSHLFPADKKESIAFALCGRRAGEDLQALCVHKLVLVPYNECVERSTDRITWPTERLRQLLNEAVRQNWAIVKIHSHPSGFSRFSKTDDSSDAVFFSAAQVWWDGMQPHASVIMLPDGAMFGRWMNEMREFEPLTSISVAGTNLRFWFSDRAKAHSEFTAAIAQAFGLGTTELLRHLSVAVVGCSGTGSILIELLIRHLVGRLVLIDPDVIEERNINRITFARVWNIGELKVDAAADWVNSIGLDIKVRPIPTSLCDPVAIKAAAECDILIGCMDGAEGRYLLNKIAAFYCIPYLDVGVRLDADGQGGINQICGTVHYLQPDGSSLLSRGAITMVAVQAEGLLRTDPREYETQVRDKYIRGVRIGNPAVASVNFHYASLLMLELLARLHCYRVEGNSQFAQFGSSLTDPRFEPMRPDGRPCPVFSKNVGRGDVVPLLDNPSLSEMVVT